MSVETPTSASRRDYSFDQVASEARRSTKARSILDWPALPLGLLVIVTLAIAASFAFRSMMTMWSGDEYSYAWLIIPLAGLLVVNRASNLPRGGSYWPGFALAAVSLLLLVTGWAAQNVSISVYGWILGIVSLVWTSLGSRGARRLAGPLAYLLFMIPLPLAFYITLSADMQLISSKLGVGCWPWSARTSRSTAMSSN